MLADETGNGAFMVQSATSGLRKESIMHIAENPISDRVGRLHRFFEGLRGLNKPDGRVEITHASLDRFFAEFNQYKRMIAQIAESPISDRVGRLHRFFEGLRGLNKPDGRVEITHASLGRFFAEFNQYKRMIAQSAPKDIEGLDYRVDAGRLERLLQNVLPIIGEYISFLHKSGESINFWDVCGLKRNEVRTASVLAWLFNSKESHGYGPTILCAFLQKLSDARKGKFPLPRQITGGYSVATESYPLGDISSRVDIVVEGTECVIFIEVKIDAPPGNEQINRYLALARGKASACSDAPYAVVYLSIDRLPLEDAHLICATWDDVACSIEEVLKADNTINVGRTLLLQFAQYVRQF
jgi:hypothetical protein